MYTLYQPEQSEWGWIPVIWYQRNGECGVRCGRYFYATKQQALQHCHELKRELVNRFVMQSS